MGLETGLDVCAVTVGFQSFQGRGAAGTRGPSPGTRGAPGPEQRGRLAAASPAPGLPQRATSGPQHPVSAGLQLKRLLLWNFYCFFWYCIPALFRRKFVISEFYCISVLFPSSAGWFLPPRPRGLKDVAVPLTPSPGCGRLLTRRSRLEWEQQPGHLEAQSLHHCCWHKSPIIACSVSPNALEAISDFIIHK